MCATATKRAVTAKVSYWIHKELLSEVLDSIRMQAQSSSARQYVHGWYRSSSSSLYDHQWGIHHSSMLCFPRISLLWHKLLPVKSSAVSDQEHQAKGISNEWYPHQWRWDVLVMVSLSKSQCWRMLG